MSNFFRFLQRGRGLLLALMASALAFSAFAQADPPGRIGRIAWLSGDVFLNNPDTGELGAAPLNQPLTSGDIVATGPGSRAEIQIGALTLRLDSGSRVEFDRIDDEVVRVLLNNGRIIAKLPTDDTRRDFELETGHGRFVPRDTGIYRFEGNNENTGATSYFGTVRFEGRDTAFDLNAGESARIWTDNAGQLNYRMAQGVRDEFTQWSAARDQRQRVPSSASSRYVSPEMTGAQDLDAYGDWSDSPEYGAAWFPRAVAADWAPYRTGHWAWVAPWGWTWVGHEPWGFAPFHYGRWVRIRGAWAWVPGTRIARPVYAPALVAWSGTPGGGISVSIGSAPPVGWFPLAPREVFVPFYRSSHNHVRYVNAPHVPHLHNIDAIVSRPHEVVGQTRFVHRDEPRAFSTAPADAFRHHRPDVRIAPRPGDARDFRDHPAQIAPPAPEPRRVTDTDERSRPDRRQNLEPREQTFSPNRTFEMVPRRERPEPEIVRQRPQPRSESPAPQRQEPTFRRDAPSREIHTDNTIRQAPPAARIEPPKPAAVQQAAPLPVRETPQMRLPDRPRESGRPPEARREGHVEARPERREERAQPPQQERRERRENREDKRDGRHERGGRPGEPERR